MMDVNAPEFIPSHQHHSLGSDGPGAGDELDDRAGALYWAALASTGDYRRGPAAAAAVSLGVGGTLLGVTADHDELQDWLAAPFAALGAFPNSPQLTQQQLAAAAAATAAPVTEQDPQQQQESLYWVVEDTTAAAAAWPWAGEDQQQQQQQLQEQLPQTGMCDGDDIYWAASTAWQASLTGMQVSPGLTVPASSLTVRPEDCRPQPLPQRQRHPDQEIRLESLLSTTQEQQNVQVDLNALFPNLGPREEDQVNEERTQIAVGLRNPIWDAGLDVFGREGPRQADSGEDLSSALLAERVAAAALLDSSDEEPDRENPSAADGCVDPSVSVSTRTPPSMPASPAAQLGVEAPEPRGKSFSDLSMLPEALLEASLDSTSIEDDERCGPGAGVCAAFGGFGAGFHGFRPSLASSSSSSTRGEELPSKRTPLLDRAPCPPPSEPPPPPPAHLMSRYAHVKWATDIAKPSQSHCE